MTERVIFWSVTAGMVTCVLLGVSGIEVPHLTKPGSHSYDQTNEPETALIEYSSIEFQKEILGKSKEELIKLLGKPLSVYSGVDPGTQSYDYSPAESYKGSVGFRVRDDATGLTQDNIIIDLDEAGVATRIHY